ncbi:MAG: EamA family transporter RarD [Limnobacter sp.]|nr:EamA family transporter RarD [Limnobacter sp.]
MSQSRGVFLSISASFLFGLMYYFTSFLHPLSGEEIFGWRMALSVPMMTVLMFGLKDWPLVHAILGRLRSEPILWIALPFSSFLLGIQLLLFMWAPLHHLSLDVSLGYFILPLSLILTGRIVFGERLTRFQCVAAILGFVGIANELIQVGTFSWPVLVINIGYPIYFVLRRKLNINNMGGLWIEALLTLPLALWFVWQGFDQQNPFAVNSNLWFLVAGLGLISTSALICHVMSSRYLPMGLFGLLGYVEPVLLVGVSLLLGETIKDHEWMTFIPIWLAVGMLATEGILELKRRHKQSEWGA